MNAFHIKAYGSPVLRADSRYYEAYFKKGLFLLFYLSLKYIKP
jgi:hypothetical protein